MESAIAGPRSVGGAASVHSMRVSVAEQAPDPAAPLLRILRRFRPAKIFEDDFEEGSPDDWKQTRPSPGRAPGAAPDPAAR
jgi:hypothetical protein